LTPPVHIGRAVGIAVIRNHVHSEGRAIGTPETQVILLAGFGGQRIAWVVAAGANGLADLFAGRIVLVESDRHMLGILERNAGDGGAGGHEHLAVLGMLGIRRFAVLEEIVLKRQLDMDAVEAGLADDCGRSQCRTEPVGLLDSRGIHTRRGHAGDPLTGVRVRGLASHRRTDVGPR